MRYYQIMKKGRHLTSMEKKGIKACMIQVMVMKFILISINFMIISLSQELNKYLKIFALLGYIVK